MTGLKQNLYVHNLPDGFWKPVDCSIERKDLQAAITESLGILGSCSINGNGSCYLGDILGEGQFGPSHWELSAGKRLYYRIKPLLPRPLIRRMRRFLQRQKRSPFPLDWPIEARYVRFQWNVLREILRLQQARSMPFLAFWPGGHRYAFVLTHDVETAEGQKHVRAVASLEESYGFRSCFNFVPELYPVDSRLLVELKQRGFEVGVHGLKHDGRLFSSQTEFLRRVEKINGYLNAWQAKGFRSPLTLRHPEWMQSLRIEYDMSFFDSDPFEPIPGGTMSIWPFFIGHFVELPYTLVQDYTLTAILGERTPRIWLEKVDFIERYHGMALINSHPDYLRKPMTWSVYEEFLKAMKARQGHWHALPREVARWWRARAQARSVDDLPNAVTACARLEGSGLVID